MKRWIAFIILVFASAAFGAPVDIKPADPATPLFRIFAPTPMKGDQSKLTFDDTHPLLVVWGVRDLRLANDRKGVQITLNAEDARAFSILTRKYRGDILLLESKGRVLEALHITSPNVNGTIGFTYPDDAAVAEYLRKRFRIGEFKLGFNSLSRTRHLDHENLLF